jgi:hypothetical protein
MKDGKFGTSWMIRQGDGTVRWVNRSGARKAARRRAFYESKGVREGVIRRRVVLATGESSGWSFNLCLVYLADRDHPDVEVVSVDDPGEDWS